MIQPAQSRSFPANDQDKNIRFRRSTDKKSLKRSRNCIKNKNQSSYQDESMIKDDQSIEHPSDCNTVCSVNINKHSLFKGQKQRIQTSGSYSAQKQSFTVRELSLFQEKRRLRDSSIAKTNEIKKLNKELTEAKSQNKNLSKRNRILTNKLNEFKKIFTQIQQQLYEQKLPFCLNCVPQFQLQKDQDMYKVEAQINLTIYQQQIKKLQYQLQQLNTFSKNNRELSSQNVKLRNQLRQKQAFYSQIIKQNQEQQSKYRKQIDRLNIEIDAINRQFHFYLQKQRQKVFKQKQKYFQIRNQMNKMHKQLKRLEITEKVKKQIQLRAERNEEVNYILSPDSSMENL